MEKNELNQYMDKAIRKLVSDAFRATIKNPKEALYLSRYAFSSRRSRCLRMKYEKKGIHIPAFLIASITGSCNLFCTGCYARANRICGEPASDAAANLPAGRWAEIFAEADRLGFGFVLLAGGEPMLYREVIRHAAKRKNLIFPIFTNGTLLDEAYLDLLDQNRNLIPVISLEGLQERTDGRRGSGTYDKVTGTMSCLKDRRILFGASVTVTSENLTEASSDEFIGVLSEKGCGIVFFIEYVPVAPGTGSLALDDAARAFLEMRQEALRSTFRNIVFLSFPGDEKYTGGCLAAGRGFFHINPSGEAEPCPFSPFSDTSMATGGLLDALQSPLFSRLRELDFLNGAHEGGCALFAHEEEIRRLGTAGTAGTDETDNIAAGTNG